MPNTKKYVSLDKLGLYDEKIKKYLADGDAEVLKGAKEYADGLAVNYDAAGAAATAEANAKAYADGKDTAIQAAQSAAETAAEAASVADGKAESAQSEVDTLEAYVGKFTHDTAKTVVEYVNAKTDGIATSGNLEALAGRVTATEGDIATIKGDYLKAADKAELVEDIAEVQSAVDTEKSRAEGIEAGLETRLAKVEGDYLKAADKEELQDNIDTVSGALERLTNGVSADEIDGVNDLINYVKEHGPEVTGMQEDIADNSEAITTLGGRVDTLEEEMNTVEGAVAVKANQEDLDKAVEALEGADTALGNRITTLEGKFGGAEGSVEDLIADAKQEAIDAAASAADTKDEAILAAAKKYADEEDAKVEERVAALESASSTHALAADLNTLAGRVTTAEGKVTTLESEMDAVEAKAVANETAISGLQTAVAGKAAQSDLDGVSGRVSTLEGWHENFVECSQEDIQGLFA